MGSVTRLHVAIMKRTRGIDQRVDEVGEKIDEHVGDRDQQDAALQQRIVARLDGLHGQAADARPGENRFGDDGAGEQRAELQAEDGEDGNQRVAERRGEKGRRDSERPLARAVRT